VREAFAKKTREAWERFSEINLDHLLRDGRFVLLRIKLRLGS
jgi:hypothetical protein